MKSETTIHELIGLVYDAAARPDLWEKFLQHLGHVLKSEMNTFYVHDLRSHHDQVSIAIGIDLAAQREYELHYASKNIFHIEGRHLFIPGAVFTSDEMCPDRREVLRSEFYNDFIRPLKLSAEGLNAILFQQHDLIGILGSIREKGSRQFDQGEIRIVQALVPHLQRAIQLQRRISRLEQSGKATMNALNCWNMGVVMLDRGGRPLLMNRTAELIFKQADGLTLGRDGLHATVPTETVILKRTIHGAILASTGHCGSPGGTVLLSRPSLKQKLQILVTPVSNHFCLFTETGAAAVVFVNDPEMETPAARSDLLRRFYSLTEAEARVACLLLEGKTLKEIADELHVTYETPRIHLKHIFEKTSTRRQSELIRRLLRTPGFISIV